MTSYSGNGDLSTRPVPQDIARDGKVNETAVFGGGCFWCAETVFKMLKGVVSVVPGYAGGTLDDPTYDKVSSGSTGHAEVIKIVYDPNIISFNDLLTVFFATHDPTTLNRQGNDVGEQYRSVIFYTTDKQKKAAEKFIDRLCMADDLMIVTQVEPLDKFYEAEDYHHDYFAKNPEAAYCQAIITPKVAKVREKFEELLNKLEK
ncbi:MAG: peptide-methionine (S)-S-oxide reductase MsrA [Patescibacteria group bacterium]